MKVAIDSNLKWTDRIWAAFIFFTRLPFWRIHQPPKAAYRTVVEHWPLVGWLTGALMGGALIGCKQFLPLTISVLIAMIVRILVTGALHEDGLTDFLDGFGGGNDRQRILDIMKDSKIGTYGVLGILFYELLFFFLLLNITGSRGDLYTFLFVVAADSFSKMIAGQIIQMLPYARPVEQAKNQVVYRKFSVPAGLSLFFQGAIPMAIFLYYSHFAGWELLLFVPCFIMYFLYLLLYKKIGGYTGDCCGALFLLVELSLYVTENLL
ncbi:MAG: adenosylcobinamide-GDP ribazoletransferase [Prevotella sp.]|jgi:adenosylcobinamide-GDP ribazoletransferase|nr:MULTISPECIES: adenosylcobinamide-GDP ribazoletransferase [unclassified Prevotella]MCH3970874.1 adenosylcobinamide-GDP ribazoletransferase [Prevotella sp.]MCH4017839.1 adenosylcobinamide-GDP ribazoletransferase [Prevotella sp.]MCH4100970.1 adenosylcobinamide-GDP ribazoletransferase [Prevotella sp.]MCH4186629.1 adenosylcobinamide-GDP ribazoletransferase [Prevotella sp.]MCH4216465.1 adenosylcobinamide-GDP ribazoletransferase [Prevotella sp.]